MRNLKKILALVLALVMVVGVMSVATAATPGTGYSDDASITKYDEAVQVLTQLGIYRGNEKGNFNPSGSITRAEVAALVYRIVHQDVTDKYVGNYNKFADVDTNDWFAGYVNYCANGEYIVGDGNGNFNPNDTVNGYQVLAIMLRALGYDREGEFQGTGWEVRTARKAAELHITENVTDGTLGAPASRELVAELIFRALLCETQNWSLANGYTTTKNTLGYETFKLGARTSAVADDVYGEPIAYYAVGSNTKAIKIRFNPIATYTDGVVDGTLYTLLSALDGWDDLAGYADKDIENVNYAVDGEDTTTTLYKSNGTVISGRGAVAEVFVADGEAYVVVKNTYVDIVKTTYNSTYGSYFTLANATLDVDYSTKTIARNTRVIFNMYEDDDLGHKVADESTVKAANSKAVTVTNTYVHPTKLASSYILVGSAKYVYDCNYASLIDISAEELDRDWLLENSTVDQILYFDDYGYVIYAEANDDSSSNETGYLLVTNSTYGGYMADNGYVNTFTAYTMDGQKTTVKGAIDAFCYSNKSDATTAADYDMVIGIYNYEKNSDGLYKLTKVSGTVSTGFGSTGVITSTVSEILAGDADALLEGTDAILNDNTVFVVANYNRNGLISGYSVVKGFKNIDDLYDGDLVDMNGKAIDFNVEYVSDHDSNTYGVDFVFVTGAATADADDDAAYADTLYYLTDATPEKFVTTYDVHTVIYGGKAGTIKVTPNLVAEEDLETGDFFTVDKTNKKTGIVTDVTPVATDAGVYYAAAGVLYVTTTDEFITMADNCVIYNINSATGEVTTLTDSDVAWIGWAWNYQLVTNLDNEIVVAAQNDYGYATVIYVVDGVYYL